MLRSSLLLRGHSGTLAQASVLRSEGDYGSDGWLYEGVGERLGELMDGSPAGAVRRQETANTGRGKPAAGRVEDRLETCPVEVKAADEAGDAFLAGQSLCVA